MPTGVSVIELSPPSADFVQRRVSSLGPWVLGGFLDSVLMGVIFCQVVTYYRTRAPAESAVQRFYNAVVFAVFGLSVLKTAQCIAVVWVQNVMDYANPDVARLLVAKAWWQVSMPLMTAVIGTTVQSFFCFRYYMLSHNWTLCVPIICAMCVGLAGVCLSLANILSGNAKAKVMWLLASHLVPLIFVGDLKRSQVHLIGVFVADFLITAGTIHSLQRRSAGLQRTALLINRLLRLVFESAIPPTVVATIDLIMTQTLGQAHLLWHMLLNIALGKVYVVSLLYTLNSINAYRTRDGSQEVYSYNDRRTSRRATNLELGSRGLGHQLSSKDQIFVHTQVSTHVSPETFSPRSEYKHSAPPTPRDDTSSHNASDHVTFAQ
ncbi:hypothetical protein MIND_00949400 [Mycena indigotica]|uniref:DUF6534 domain-containing protein n=1 Tax=Mycena indigotica TaxID=2126181 RepID=A0A8H6SCX8_9AGAR|nr:uncharacterized protein MIND_00949400 [Mycena indigotica]KAF7297163.1 hypothetical protein MIND_00949400 [Mycena indigotica]